MGNTEVQIGSARPGLNMPPGIDSSPSNRPYWKLSQKTTFCVF